MHRLVVLGLMLLLSVGVLSGCGGQSTQPKEIPTKPGRLPPPERSG